MSSRKSIMAALVAAALCIGAFLLFVTPNNSQAPRYVALSTQPAGPFGREMYEFLLHIPFPGGRFWIMTSMGITNRHSYYYDLEQKKVLGELTNAWCIFSDPGSGKMLCYGEVSQVAKWKEMLVTYLDRRFAGRFPTGQTRTEAFWILDIGKNTSHRLGQFEQYATTGSSWVPSPDYHRAYTVPSTGSDKVIYVADLEKESLRQILYAGKVCGWWDKGHLLVKISAGDLVLLDVDSESAATLFSKLQLDNAVEAAGTEPPPGGYKTMPVWNGSGYDFLLIAEKGMGLFEDGSFLAKLERNPPGLVMLDNHFPFHWGGVFDGTETHYAYGGESGKPGSGGDSSLYVMDVGSHQSTLLAPSNSAPQYTLPNFYKGSLIYWRDQNLWRTDLNGSNNERLLNPNRGR